MLRLLAPQDAPQGDKVTTKRARCRSGQPCLQTFEREEAVTPGGGGVLANASTFGRHSLRRLSSCEPVLYASKVDDRGESVTERAWESRVLTTFY